MAYRKVNDTSLASIADAIRAKGGTSDTLVFPEGFVSAISAIQTSGSGGGTGGESDISALLIGIIERTATDVTIPVGCEKIGAGAFFYYLAMKNCYIPEGVKKLATQCFSNCVRLSEITLPSSITSIEVNSFKDCNSLTKINVPWAEGEVKNAPWGATKATINYDYTGG